MDQMPQEELCHSMLKMAISMCESSLLRVSPWLFAIDFGNCDELGHVWMWQLHWVLVFG